MLVEIMPQYRLSVMATRHMHDQTYFVGEASAGYLAMVNLRISSEFSLIPSIHSRVYITILIREDTTDLLCRELLVRTEGSI